MTEQQPKEYIITEEQLIEHRSLSFDVGGAHFERVYEKRANDDLSHLEEEIRSRPVNTIAQPEKAKNPSKKRRDAWIWNSCRGCKFVVRCKELMIYLPPCGRDYDIELSEMHDAAVAEKAREKVLDEVQVLRHKMTHTTSLHCGCITAEYFKKEIESLRQHKERPCG